MNSSVTPAETTARSGRNQRETIVRGVAVLSVSYRSDPLVGSYSPSIAGRVFRSRSPECRSNRDRPFLFRLYSVVIPNISTSNHSKQIRTRVFRSRPSRSNPFRSCIPITETETASVPTESNGLEQGRERGLTTMTSSRKAVALSSRVSTEGSGNRDRGPRLGSTGTGNPAVSFRIL